MSTHKIKTPRERLNLIRFIEKLNSDKVWIIEIKQYRKKRTPSQNKLLHLWFACVADETGNTAFDIKDYYKDKFLPKHTVEIYGEAIEKPFRTRDLNTLQMKEFLDKIDSDASTEGIRLLYPEDLQFEEFYNKYSNYIG